MPKCITPAPASVGILLPVGLWISAFLFPVQMVTGDTPEWSHVEIHRFPAVEAFQGVAVDQDHFYAIDSRAIGKYRKDTGERIGRWESDKRGQITHLNSGIIAGVKLYLAHSNFPKLPAQSSLEILDTATMQPLDRHVFENPPGALTWIVPEEEGWLACFAHYRSTSDPALSRIVRFDADWNTLKSWTFPTDLLERFSGYSSSGGAIGPAGKLFVTGHDAPELYVLEYPDNNEKSLKWVATVAISATGQAFAWDRSEPDHLYSISRKTREVIVSRLTLRN